MRTDLPSSGGRGPVPVLLLLLTCVAAAAAFNLDTRFAVIKEGDTAGSLFGVSVALHRQVVGQKRHLLLVGAPKQKADPVVPANQTGAMFACPISIDRRDCTKTNLISADDVDSESVFEGMWLGVSVASQDQPGGRVMACGHRYSRSMDNGANLRMIGKCFIRGNDLSYTPNTDFQWQDPYEVCNPLGDLLMEGMCNMGMSAVITQTEVVAGAPGCYNWHGSPYVIYRDPQDKYDTRKYKLPRSEVGNKYVGYSVAKDKDVLSLTEETVVTGAPRDGSKGSVLLAKVRSDNRDLQVQATLRGQQVGSYFGNSVALVDLNNDGWKEIIVGAPFYFDRRKEEGGAVYVFMNENGSFKEKTDRIFAGPQESGLGMAVAAIGDVNQDGFQDFAAGAPFEGTGRVFVWMGSRDAVFSKPSQVIVGKDVTNGGFRTFGYSISGGLDVDNNNYPDIVVGSLDDRVALLRARPVIHLKKTFTVTPSIVDPQSCDSCIEVKVCFSYTLSTGDPNFRKNITVRFVLEADWRSSRTRLRFLRSGKNVYSGFLSMPSQDCQTLQMEVLSPIRDKVTPIAFVVNTSLYEPQISSRVQLEDLDAFPVVSQGEVLTDRAEIHFQKACGPDNKCESNLQMTAMFATAEQMLPVQDGQQVLLYDSSITKLNLLVNISNVPSGGRLAEDAHNTVLNVTIPPSLTYSNIRPVTTDCSLKDTNLLCELGNPFAANQKASITIIFETSGISLDTREIKAVLQLSTLSEQPDLTPLTKELLVDYVLEPTFVALPSLLQTEFSGHVVGESAMKSTADIGSPVEFKFIVSIKGKPLGSLGSLQVVFDWPLQVKNEKWLLYLSEIEIRTTSSYYCAAADIVNPLNLTVSEHQAHQSSSSRKRRRRRRRDEDSLEPVSYELQTSLYQQKTSQLSCVTGSALCKTFSCDLHNMSSKATLTVRARLWNSTMLEDYKDNLQIEISGEARLNLLTDKPTIRMDNTSTTVKFSVYTFPVLQGERASEAPLWIIIVSVLAGVLLLGLIIILLWKCGFFRRTLYFKAMPKYHGVKICKAERYRVSQKLLNEDINKKHWITNWTEKEQYY